MPRVEAGADCLRWPPIASLIRYGATWRQARIARPITWTCTTSSQLLRLAKGLLRRRKEHMKLWTHRKDVHGMELVVELVLEPLVLGGAGRRRRLPMSSPLVGAGMAEEASLAMPTNISIFGLVGNISEKVELSNFL